MSATAVRVQGLGKEYRLGRAVERYPTLRESIARGVRGLASLAARAPSRRAAERFWALRDVSFEIPRGEVVGIVGGNGAGKSTLLKILARVTEPTEGRAEIHGRVGSLLEVGTGFHPELTGRENTFLNGAILGMRRSEIARKFDQIVAFAEVERFIDTPVKHYSSGMYLRLAFAVAAHLEPEILLVDEVLAVGDAAFQKKCMGKMGDVAQGGRTVVFVSHNMDAIRRLCGTSVLLEHGRVAMQGESAAVVASYLSQEHDRIGPNACIDLSDAQRRGSGEARFVSVRYSSLNETQGCHAFSGGPLEFQLTIASDAARPVGSMSVSLKTQSGTTLIDADILSGGETLRLREGRTVIRLRMHELHLNPGIYVVGLWLGHSFGAPFDHLESAFDIEVMHIEPRALDAPRIFSGVVPCRFVLSQDECNRS